MTEGQPPLFAGDATGRLPLIFVGSPLSSLSDEDRRLLDAWCKNVEDALLNERSGVAEWTLRTHFPFQQSAPWRGDERNPRDVYELNSGLVWTEVDAVILFDLRGGSLGEGMELAWAVSLGLPVLVLVPADERVSRQVEGMSVEHDVSVASFSGASDLQLHVRRWLTERRAWIETGELRRALHRERAASLAQVLRDRWQALSGEQQEAVVVSARISPARFVRLLTDPAAIAQASLHELLTLAQALSADIGQALSPDGRSLTPGQLRGLQQAAVECGWDAPTVVELVMRAQGELAASTVRRLPLTSIDDWVRFKESQIG